MSSSLDGVTEPTKRSSEATPAPPPIKSRDTKSDSIQQVAKGSMSRSPSVGSKSEPSSVSDITKTPRRESTLTHRKKSSGNPDLLKIRFEGVQSDIGDHDTGFEDQTDDLTKSLSIPDLVICINQIKAQGKSLNELQKKVAKLKSDLEALRKKSPLNLEDKKRIATLENKIKENNDEILQVKETISDLKLAIAESSVKSVEGALAVSEEAARGAESLKDAGDAVGESAEVLLAPIFDAVSLKKNMKAYRENKDAIAKKREELASVTDIAIAAQLQSELDNLLAHKKGMVLDLGEVVAKTASTGMEVGEIGLEALTTVGTTTLEVVGCLVSMGTGAIAVGVHGKRIYSNVRKNKRIFDETRKINTLKASTSSPLLNVLEMRLKSLKSQGNESTVSNIKSVLGITAGTAGLGTSVAVVGGLVATGVLLSAAGAGIITLGVLAASIGIGYAVYTHRSSLRVKASRFANWINRIHLATKSKMLGSVTASQESKYRLAEVKKEKIGQKIAMHDVNISQIQRLKEQLQVIQVKFDQAISKRIKAEKEIENFTRKGNISAANQVKSRMRKIIQEVESSKEELLRVKSEIDYLSEQVLKLDRRTEKSRILGDELQRMNTELDEMKRRGEDVKQTIEQTRFKSQMLREKAIISRLKDRLNISEDEVIRFKNELKEGLKKEEVREQIRELLEKLDVPIIESNLFQTVINYILAKA